MKVLLRKETTGDCRAVSDLVELAFKEEKFSDHQEHKLVERLRFSKSFVSDLSIVAEIDGQIVGYILLTRIEIGEGSNLYDALCLAPVAVHPNFQKQGIGGSLIQEAHGVARSLGFGSVVVLGHQDYYPRFGYLPAHEFGITLPFDVPRENVFAIELLPQGLEDVQGKVIYDQAFGL